MAEQWRYLWKTIVGADVFDRVVMVVSLIISLAPPLFALVKLGGELPWWSGLVVGVPLLLIDVAWVTTGRALQLEKEREPKIEISDPVLSPVHSSQETLRRFRIIIKNISYGPIKGCAVKEVSLESLTKTTGQSRRFMQSHEITANNQGHDYAKTFDLNGFGDTQPIEIAEYDCLCRPDHFVMLYATSPGAPTHNAIPTKPHRLKISVTAENMAVAQMREFEIGYEPDAFYVKSIGKQMSDVISSP